MMRPVPGAEKVPVTVMAAKLGFAPTFPKEMLFVAVFCKVKLASVSVEPLDTSAFNPALVTVTPLELNVVLEFKASAPAFTSVAPV